MERYHVATVSGDISMRKSAVGKPTGLSAHVIDRPNACKVVATFRSEERLDKRAVKGKLVGSPTRGRDGALAAAEALAAEWNADEAE